MSWPSVKLSDVLEFHRGITFKPEDKVENFSSSSVVCMRTKNVQAQLDESDIIAVPESFVKRDELYLQEGDLLISSANSWNLVGKVVRIPQLNYRATAGGFISILRPLKQFIDPDYLYRFIGSDEQQHKIRHLGRQTTNISNLDRKRFLDLRIPLPPLSVQKQIAAVLEKADNLRQQSQQMERELNSLAQSVFLDMFGDPILNPKKFTQTRLEEVVSVQSGATPSKARDDFWDGNYPWVSPKDMKRVYIDDSIDHVSSQAFNETNLKKIEEGSLLVVVRGMILAHTVPIATNTRKVAINQDIKALKVELDGILSKFLLWNMKVQHDNILSKVSTAAHGTKRLDMPDLMGISILIPSVEQQKKFVHALEKIDLLIKAAEQSKLRNEEIYSSLMQRAFKGELDLKNVA